MVHHLILFIEFVECKSKLADGHLEGRIHGAPFDPFHPSACRHSPTPRMLFSRAHPSADHHVVPKRWHARGCAPNVPALGRLGQFFVGKYAHYCICSVQVYFLLALCKFLLLMTDERPLDPTTDQRVVPV
jgi:hypothetical protein